MKKCDSFRVKGFKSTEIFEGIAEALKEDGANLVKKVKGIFGFKVKDTNGNEVLWIVDAKNGSGKVELNGSGKFKYGNKLWNFIFNQILIYFKTYFYVDKPDVTLSMADKDLVDLMTGKLNPQKAFFQGKLKVQGNMGLAMKLQEFQKQASEAMKSKL